MSSHKIFDYGKYDYSGNDAIENYQLLVKFQDHILKDKSDLSNLNEKYKQFQENLHGKHKQDTVKVSDLRSFATSLQHESYNRGKDEGLFLAIQASMVSVREDERKRREKEQKELDEMKKKIERLEQEKFDQVQKELDRTRQKHQDKKATFKVEIEQERQKHEATKAQLEKSKENLQVQKMSEMTKELERQREEFQRECDEFQRERDELMKQMKRMCADGHVGARVARVGGDVRGARVGGDVRGTRGGHDSDARDDGDDSDGDYVGPLHPYHLSEVPRRGRDSR